MYNIKNVVITGEYINFLHTATLLTDPFMTICSPVQLIIMNHRSSIKPNFLSNFFILITKIKTKLEIWGKAQRKSARHRKSDWGKSRMGAIPQCQSHGPELKCISIRSTPNVDL